MKWIITFVVGILCGASGLAYVIGVTPAVLLRMPVAAAPGTVAPMTAPALASSPAMPPATVPVIAVAPAAVAPVAPVVAPMAPVPPVDLAPSLPVMAGATPVQQASQADSPPTKPAENLLIPVAGIKASQLVDTFDQARGSEQRHEALDILAPRGTQVFAVADGKVAKLFESKPGGITLYQFDVTEKYAYYYAHLDSYAPSVTEGTWLKRGDLLGYVGSTGNANPAAPHLHFAILELTPEKKWWKGRPVNPYPLLRQ